MIGEDIFKSLGFRQKKTDHDTARDESSHKNNLNYPVCEKCRNFKVSYVERVNMRKMLISVYFLWNENNILVLNHYNIPIWILIMDLFGPLVVVIIFVFIIIFIFMCMLGFKHKIELSLRFVLVIMLMFVLLLTYILMLFFLLQDFFTCMLCDVSILVSIFVFVSMFVSVSVFSFLFKVVLLRMILSTLYFIVK